MLRRSFIVEPGPNASAAPSGKPTEIIGQVDRYVSLLLDYIEANVDPIGFGWCPLTN